MLPLITQIKPIEEKGGMWIPRKTEVSVAVVDAVLAVEKDDVLAAKLAGVQQDLANYQRWYQDEQKKVRALEEKLKEPRNDTIRT
jgi:hypothetical protein